MLIHSLKRRSSQGKARPKPRAWYSIWVCGVGGRAQGWEPFTTSCLAGHDSAPSVLGTGWADSGCGSQESRPPELPPSTALCLSWPPQAQLLTCERESGSPHPPVTGRLTRLPWVEPGGSVRTGRLLGWHLLHCHRLPLRLLCLPATTVLSYLCYC